MASWVSALPSGKLTRIRPLMAQPVASSSGPRVRWRSLIQAISIDGPEMISTTPPTATSLAHQGCSPMKPDTKAPRKVAMAPTPTPRAAMMPTILPTSTGAGGAVGVGGGDPGTAAAAVTASRASDSFSLAAAKRASCCSIIRMNFL